jgi:hypothetical protein
MSGDLERIARKYNADKARWQEMSNRVKNTNGLGWPDSRVEILPGHNYVELYEKYFSHLRYERIMILEIGMGNYPTNGFGLQMWLEYFPNATVHVIDNNARNFTCDFTYDSSRVHFFCLDQGDTAGLAAFVRNSKVKYDIIVDDGSHIPSHQVETYKQFFPLVTNPGIYVVEDLFTSSKENRPNFYTFLQDELQRLQSGSLLESGTEKNEDLQSIHCYRSIAFFFKNSNKITI